MTAVGAAILEARPVRKRSRRRPAPPVVAGGRSYTIAEAAAVIDAARAVFRSSRIGDDAGLTVDGPACWALGEALDAPLDGRNREAA